MEQPPNQQPYQQPYPSYQQQPARPPESQQEGYSQLQPSPQQPFGQPPFQQSAQAYPPPPMYQPQMQPPPMYQNQIQPPPMYQPQMQPPPMYQPQMQPPPMYQQPPNLMYPPQSGPYPYSMQQPVQVNQVVQVNVSGKTGPGFLIRALWYIFIGWWLGLFWLNLGYFFVLTIIGLPLGLVMLNRLPWVLTLRPASAPQVNVNISGNMTTINIVTGQQHSFLIRTLYFLFVGWWVGYLWACLGYACCLFIVTLPLGLIMLNRLPAVLTLRKN